MPDNHNIPSVFRGEYIRITDVQGEIAKVYKPDGGSDDTKKPKVALVLSGGGATGTWDSGVLEALEQKGIRPDIIVGSSAGALNAAATFYQTLGVENKKIDEFIQEANNEPGIPPVKYDSFAAKLTALMSVRDKGAQYVLDKPEVISQLSDKGVTYSGNEIGVTTKGALIVFSIIIGNDLILIAALALLTALILIVMGLPLSWIPASGCAYSGIAGVLLLLVSVPLIVLEAVKRINTTKSIFETDNLYKTIYYSAITPQEAGGDGISDRYDFKAKLDETLVKEKSQKIVNQWYKDTYPELIMTGTDLSAKSDFLFTLVAPKTYSELIEKGWLTAQLLRNDTGKTAKECREEYFNAINERIQELSANEKKKKMLDDQKEGAMFMDGGMLFETFITSASMPTIFPTRRVELINSEGGQVHHYFTDGGTLNNSPIHVAIDAGATHIISLELLDLACIKPDADDIDDKKEGYSLVDTFLKTFFTLNGLATYEDISKSSSWNKFLVNNPDTTDPTKRIVQIYRISPANPERGLPYIHLDDAVGLIDFNGKVMKDGTTLSLEKWMQDGRNYTLNEESFWRATIDIYPWADNDGK